MTYISLKIENEKQKHGDLNKQVFTEINFPIILLIVYTATTYSLTF